MKLLIRFTAFVLLGYAFACSDNPASPDRRDTEFEYSRLFLDVYFIFRDQLPEDPFVFSTPKELYASVNEPYTEYFTPEDAEVFLSLLNTKTTGLGIAIDSSNTGYVITRVIVNSPADVAGVMEGDTLLFVDGINVSELTFDVLRNKLRGQIGETKVLSVRRGSAEVQITITIAEFFVPSVFQDSLDTEVAYIQLITFLTETGVSGGSSEEFRTALAQTAWANYTIFDLRFNGGGELEQAVDIVSEFLESQTPLVSIKARVLNEQSNTGSTEQRVLVSREAGSAKERKFIVLINHFTASASELLVSALKSNRSDIQTVGETTFGKARGQILSRTPESGLAKVTKMTIEPIVGVSYDLKGILPDIPTLPGQDALEVALQQIRGTLSKSRAPAHELRRIRSLHRMQKERSFQPLNITYDYLPSRL